MGIEKTGGTRIEAEPKSHINCLELIHGCKFSAVGKVTVYIYIYLYNATIFNCLYSMGGTHSIQCNSAAKDIWQLCIEREREICIFAALIPGKNNTQADMEFRVFVDNKRWNC